LERLKDKKEELNDAILTCSKGRYPDFFKFALTQVATFGRVDSALESKFESPCFSKTSMKYVRVDNSTFNIEIETSDPSSSLCSVKALIFFFIFFIFLNDTLNVDLLFLSQNKIFFQDFYLFGTTLNYHVENIFFHGKHVVSFKNLNEKEIKNIETYGINVFRFCDSLENLLRKNLKFFFQKSHFFSVFLFFMNNNLLILFS
jgi:hypothetical protein